MDGRTGPLRKRFPCTHEFSRVIAGGDADGLPAFNAGHEPMNSTLRIHDEEHFIDGLGQLKESLFLLTRLLLRLLDQLL